MTDLQIIELHHVIYPEDIYVTADLIIGWAHDTLVNNAVDDHVKAHGVIPDTPAGEATYAAIAAAQARPDVEEARTILADAGSHTFEQQDIRHGIAVNRMRDAMKDARVGRPCFPKEQHATRGAAEAQMRSITNRGLEKDADKIHVYVCAHCHTWHVGHRS